jgi:hypothetical protein
MPGHFSQEGMNVGLALLVELFHKRLANRSIRSVRRIRRTGQRRQA